MQVQSSDARVHLRIRPVASICEYALRAQAQVLFECTYPVAGDMKRSQPLSAHAEPSAIRIRSPDLDGIRDSAVAFITYGEGLQHFTSNHDQRALFDLVHNALEAGAIIVNLLQ